MMKSNDRHRQGNELEFFPDIDISVVVPTCGRADLLNRCIAALTQQDLYYEKYEIIIVDDGPSAATEQIVQAWKARAREKGLGLFYIANHRTHGPAAARNRGWEAAHASIVAFTDDDTVPDKSWLQSGINVFKKSPHVDAVWGRIDMPLSDTPTDYERDAKQLETAEFVTANCFCRKLVLQELKGFDERFRFAWREDSDFYFRLLNMQANIVHAPDAVIVHPVRPAAWGVSLSQQKKIFFDALLFKKHPSLYRKRIRASARWDYYLIVAALLTGVGALFAGKLTIVAVAGCVWLAMTARFILSRLQKTTKSVSHIGEMVLTSVVIPPLAVFWRMVGAVRFRALLF